MTSDIVWDDVNFENHDYNKFASYGQSKTANILFSVELDRRLGDRGVHAYAVHPGLIYTELGRYMTKEDMDELIAMASAAPSGGLPPAKSLEQGAATTVYAATAPELDTQGGAYLADCQVTDEHAPWARDSDAAVRLWTLTETPRRRTIRLLTATPDFGATRTSDLMVERRQIPGDQFRNPIRARSTA